MHDFCNRWQRPAASVWMTLAAVVLATACGGDGGGDGSGPAPAPRFVVASHGTADFSRSGDACPFDLDFSIYLQPDGTGWVSMDIEWLGSEVVAVTWSRAEGTIEVVAPPIDVWIGSASVGWRDLSVVPEDVDRDATAETGSATIRLTCDWWEYYEDHHDEQVSDFDLAQPTGPAQVYIANDPQYAPIYSFANDVVATSSRPLLTETTSSIRLLADGEPVAATVTPISPVGPFSSRVRIDPTGNVPFGAMLTVDAAGATDAFGNAGEFHGEAVETIEDPGPITSNPSFESEGGWIGLRTTGANDDFSPVDGERYAYVYSTDLVGYFDVPMDASELTFQTASYNWQYDCPAGAGISVRAATQLPRTTEEVDSIPCDDCVYGEIIPWHKVTVDLRGVRGQRVVIRASGGEETECAPDAGFEELELDDFRIR